MVSNADYAQNADDDLLVLDRQGEKLLHTELEKASYLSKSDGVYCIYPLAWKDNNTIVMERDIFDEKGQYLGRGVREVNINTGKFRDHLSGPDIEPTVMQDILGKHNARQWDLLHPLWSPDRSKLAYNTYFNTLWVYDVEKKQYYLVGTGTLVKLLDDRKLVWYKDLYSGL